MLVRGGSLVDAREVRVTWIRRRGHNHLESLERSGLLGDGWRGQGYLGMVGEVRVTWIRWRGQGYLGSLGEY